MLVDLFKCSAPNLGCVWASKGVNDNKPLSQWIFVEAGGVRAKAIERRKLKAKPL